MGEIRDIGKKGDLKHRITVNGNDELSDLASSINSTFHALQKSERKLEIVKKIIEASLKIQVPPC